MASKRYDNPIWLVGDLADAPLADRSLHVILNIFLPSNYLQELREVLFDRSDRRAYSNTETVLLFARQFKVKEAFRVCYTQPLTAEELDHLQLVLKKCERDHNPNGFAEVY